LVRFSIRCVDVPASRRRVVRLVAREDETKRARVRRFSSVGRARLCVAV